jgi:hypothetical protein
MALVLFIFMAYVARVCTSKFLNVLALQAHVPVRSRSNKNNRAIRFEWFKKCTFGKMTQKHGPVGYFFA